MAYSPATTNDKTLELVAEGIRAGLNQNGQTVGIPSDVNIAGSVTRFWFEVKPNFFTIEFTGNVECDREFVSKRTNTLIYKSRYSGTYTKKTGGGRLAHGRRPVSRILSAAQTG